MLFQLFWVRKIRAATLRNTLTAPTSKDSEVASACRLVIDESISRSTASANARAVSSRPLCRFACSWRANSTIMKTENTRIGTRPTKINRTKYALSAVGLSNQRENGVGHRSIQFNCRRSLEGIKDSDGVVRDLCGLKSTRLTRLSGN